MMLLMIIQSTSDIEPELSPESVFIGEVGTHFDLIKSPMILHVDIVIHVPILHGPVIDCDEPHEGMG